MTSSIKESHETIGVQRVLYASRAKWRTVLLIGIGFVVIGVVMIINTGDFLAWFTTCFFVLVAGVGGAQLVGRGATLTLDADTFMETNLGRTTTERFDECADFKVYRRGGVEQVVFNRARDVETHAGEMNKSISGRSSGLHDTFSMPGQELADLLNSYQAFAIQRSWQRHEEAVTMLRQRLDDEFGVAGMECDIISTAADMDLPEDMASWPSILVVGKERETDGCRAVMLCVDVLSPVSRWVPRDTKEEQAFDMLRADELRIIEPDSGETARIVRE